MDLATEWRSRRWRRLLNIIDRLPRDSAYVEALSDDEQLAEQMIRQPDPPKAPRRRMADWSPTVELLTAILDRLGEVTMTIAALGGAKPRKFPRAPHPVTAFERIRNRKREAKHRSVVARLLPGKNKKTPQPDPPAE